MYGIEKRRIQIVGVEDRKQSTDRGRDKANEREGGQSGGTFCRISDNSLLLLLWALPVRHHTTLLTAFIILPSFLPSNPPESLVLSASRVFPTPSRLVEVSINPSTVVCCYTHGRCCCCCYSFRPMADFRCPVEE